MTTPIALASNPSYMLTTHRSMSPSLSLGALTYISNLEIFIWKICSHGSSSCSLSNLLYQVFSHPVPKVIPVAHSLIWLLSTTSIQTSKIKLHGHPLSILHSSQQFQLLIMSPSKIDPTTVSTGPLSNSGWLHLLQIQSMLLRAYLSLKLPVLEQTPCTVCLKPSDHVTTARMTSLGSVFPEGQEFFSS